MAKSTKQKSKKKVSNIMLVLICTMIILYTAASFALQYFVQSEISPTLTTAFFAFWSVEIVNLTFIKTSKLKHGTDTIPETSDSTEDTINEDE